MTGRQYSRNELLIGAGCATAAGVVTLRTMGPATIGLCAGCLVAYMAWARAGRMPARPARGLTCAYAACLVVQACHVGEEWWSGFPKQFPALVGGSWTSAEYLWFNGSWLCILGIAGLALRRGAATAYLGAWFLALVAGVGNGIGHLAIDAWLGRTFPGTFTAPICLVAGLALVTQLSKAPAHEPDGRSETALGGLRRVWLLLEGLIFTVVVPGFVTVWLPRDILGIVGPLPPPGRAWVVALGPLTLGLLIYARCVWEFALRGRGIPAPVDHPKRLVVTGLYRYVRNPMYVGVILVLLGEALLFESWSLVLYMVGFFLFIHVNVVVYEEPNLRNKFGESYTSYAAAVRRWRPGKPYG